MAEQKTLVKRAPVEEKKPKIKKTLDALEMRTEAQRFGKESIQTIYSLMTLSENERIKLDAARELLDRGFGKAPAAMEVTGKNGGDLVINLVRFGEGEQ